MKRKVLITGASGEVGTALINALAASGEVSLITIDPRELLPEVAEKVDVQYRGSVLDAAIAAEIENSYQLDTIFHLAGVLSTLGEKEPLLAHEVNVNGTMNMLSLADRISRTSGQRVKFIFPSTIAAHGFCSFEEKRDNPRIKEEEFLTPITMYGLNKVYCENLGCYFSDNFAQLSSAAGRTTLDFRAVRFPGLISAETLPSAGTSDYGPEMVHAAARGEPYSCFVRPDTRIPFMAMPDAVDALVQLAAADTSQLSSRIYNLSAFSLSAEEIAGLVRRSFPDAAISYNIDPVRQRIVDSWPGDYDDSRARADWGFKPIFNAERAFSEYLVPSISERYLVTEMMVANF